MVLAAKTSAAPVSKGKPSSRAGGVAIYSLSVLPKENQPAEGKAEKEAYISLTGLFKKVYEGNSDVAYAGKNTVIDEDTGVETTTLYCLFSLRDVDAKESMVLKSRPFVQPGGKGTENVSTEKWKQIAVLKGKIYEGKQKYFGTNEKGDMFFVNTRTPK